MSWCRSGESNDKYSEVLYHSVSQEGRTCYDVPDPADVHIIDRPDADTDLCFVMHARNVCWDQYGNFGSVDK